MHQPVGPAWLVWLETSGVAVAMRHGLWLYPIVEIVHIVGFVVLVGAAVMLTCGSSAWHASCQLPTWRDSSSPGHAPACSSSSRPGCCCSRPMPPSGPPARCFV